MFGLIRPLFFRLAEALVDTHRQRAFPFRHSAMTSTAAFSCGRRHPSIYFCSTSINASAGVPSRSTWTPRKIVISARDAGSQSYAWLTPTPDMSTVVQKAPPPNRTTSCFPEARLSLKRATQHRRYVWVVWCRILYYCIAVQLFLWSTS